MNGFLLLAKVSLAKMGFAGLRAWGRGSSVGSPKFRVLEITVKCVDVYISGGGSLKLRMNPPHSVPQTFGEHLLCAWHKVP